MNMNSILHMIGRPSNLYSTKRIIEHYAPIAVSFFIVVVGKNKYDDYKEKKYLEKMELDIKEEEALRK